MTERIEMIEMIDKMTDKILKTVRSWRSWYPCALICVVMLLLAILGARLQNNLFTFGMIGVICVVIGLSGLGKLKEAYYPYLVWAIGLSLLLQSTLISAGLIGSDIHTEYYFYYQSLNYGWNYADPHPYNSAVGSTILAPILTNLLGIPGYWIFKLVFPLFFSVVPVLLYFVFRKEFGAKTAFFSALFFVIMPTWSMELIGIPRQMLGEIMLALIFLVIIVTKWRMRVKVPVIIVLGILGTVLHYIIGPMIIAYLGIGSLFLLFFKRRTLAVRGTAVILAVLMGSCVLYYGWVSGGMPLRLLTTGLDVINNLVVRVLPSQFSFMNQDVVIPAYPYEIATESKTGYPEGMAEELDKAVTMTAVDSLDPKSTETATVSNLPEFISSTDPAVTAAWGGDFAATSPWGKVFRIFQYLTQICVVAGCVLLIRNRKKHSAEYLCFNLAATVLLGVCMFLPHFAALINATRFYHLALFMLAPVFVTGGIAIFRNYRVLALGLIIPYFAFTSGAMFELSKASDISKIDMPYSVPLSNYRVDMTGVFTENDMKVRDWAVKNNLVIDMYADTHSQLLLWEKAYTYWRDLREALNTGEFNTGDYIFLSERNNQDKTIILRPTTGGSSTGRRTISTYSECGLDKVIARGTIVYQQGGAFVLKVAR